MNSENPRIVLENDKTHLILSYFGNQPTSPFRNTVVVGFLEGSEIQFRKIDLDAAESYGSEDDCGSCHGENLSRFIWEPWNEWKNMLINRIFYRWSSGGEDAYDLYVKTLRKYLSKAAPARYRQVAKGVVHGNGTKDLNIAHADLMAEFFEPSSYLIPIDPPLSRSYGDGMLNANSLLIARKLLAAPEFEPFKYAFYRILIGCEGHAKVVAMRKEFERRFPDHFLNDLWLEAVQNKAAKSGMDTWRLQAPPIYALAMMAAKLYAGIEPADWDSRQSFAFGEKDFETPGLTNWMNHGPGYSTGDLDGQSQTYGRETFMTWVWEHYEAELAKQNPNILTVAIPDRKAKRVAPYIWLTHQQRTHEQQFCKKMDQLGMH